MYRLVAPITFICFMALSCKPIPKHDLTLVDPCGDPPPVLEAPRMRVIDKATGDDYFIRHQSLYNTLRLQRYCTDQEVMPDLHPIEHNTKIYGVAVGFSYLPLLAGDSCNKLIWSWDNQNRDTLYFYTHAGDCMQVLDSVYINGEKLQQITDTMQIAPETYYTIFK